LWPVTGHSASAELLVVKTYYGTRPVCEYNKTKPINQTLNNMTKVTQINCIICISLFITVLLLEPSYGSLDFVQDNPSTMNIKLLVNSASCRAYLNSESIKHIFNKN